jgi:uncharacterized membrane protein
MGIVLVVPLGITIWILYWIFYNIDSILHPLIEFIWGHPIPGIGFGATIILIYLVGLIASNFIGRRLIRFGESMLAKVPVVRPLYQGIKQILESFSSPNQTGFMQVVLVEFPHKGMKSIGFVTNEFSDKSGEKTYNVFIPTAPNPTTGFLEIIKESELIPTRLSVDDAVKMVVSAGRIIPEKIGDRLSPTIQEG